MKEKLEEVLTQKKKKKAHSGKGDVKMRQGKEHPGKPAVTRAGRDKKQVLPGSPPGTAALPTSSFPANEDDFGLLASGTMKE